MPADSVPPWEELLSSAARLQKIVPGAVLVGGTAAAAYAHHRVSVDHDHALSDLREHGASPLQQLACQLSNPMPYDLEGTNLAEYKHLVKRMQDWNTIRSECIRLAAAVIHPML